MGGVRRILAMAACLGTAASVGAAADDATLTRLETWSNVFAQREVVFHYGVKSRGAFQGRLGWALSADQRTLQRGEAGVELPAAGEAAVAIAWRAPGVREGVVLPASLGVQLYDPQGKSLARHECPVLIFASNPFAGRTEWLRRRRLTLFDPIGPTAKCLESVGVPFEQARRPAGIGELQEGILLVGEGVSLVKNRGLDLAMVAAARRGVAVLCLAPCEGHLPLPGQAGEGRLPVRLVLQHEEAIARLDKRLDTAAWPPDGRSARSSLMIRAERDRVIAAVETGPKGWEWLEAHYPPPGGALVVCGLGIIEHWDATPAPRYALARLLEYLGQGPNRNQDPKMENRDE